MDNEVTRNMIDSGQHALGTNTDVLVYLCVCSLGNTSAFIDDVHG